MPRITSGVVRYLRRVNTGNYEHKEFSADISWSVDDGDAPLAADEMMEIAADRAVRVVHERLGLAERPLPQLGPPVVETSVATPLSTAAGACPPTANVTGKLVSHDPKPTKAAKAAASSPEQQEVEAIKAKVAARLVSEGKTVPTADPLLDAAKAADPLLGDEPPGADDPLAGISDDDDPLTALPQEIGDDDLLAAAEKAIVRVNDAIKVRRVIGKYAKQLPMIPQDRRQAFIDELAAL